jgi:hypothetical protein
VIRKSLGNRQRFSLVTRLGYSEAGRGIAVRDQYERLYQ